MALLTRKEAAAQLRISVDLLDQERSAGRLAYIQRKSGSKVWITEDAITEYLTQITHQARPEPRTTRTGYRRRRG